MSAATTSTGRATAQSAAQPATPPAMPPEPADATEPVAATEPAYELVDIDRYEVFDDGPIGYVEVIPPLFICYSGHPYPKAIEVAQVFEFDEAVRRVRAAASRQRASHDHGCSAA